MAKREEFTQWWVEIEPKLLSFAFRYTTTNEIARDLVQDVAVLALKDYDRFTIAEDFYRWAYSTLHWLVVDALKGRRGYSLYLESARIGGKTERRYGSLEEAREPSTKLTPEQAVLEGEIKALITRLPKQQQAVFLGVWEGRSNEEIAKELKIKVSTVRSLLRFARRRLITLLEEEVKNDKK